MFQIKTLSIRKDLVFSLTIFSFLLIASTIAPLLNQQAITGSIVNAMLFMAAIILGREAAILLGLIPSLIALASGLLPSVLAPMIPLIIIGNTILILIFSQLRKKNYWLAVSTASLLKFLFLFGTSSVVINLLIKKEVAVKVATMMSWPQLFTALAGGLLAYIFLRAVKKF